MTPLAFVICRGLPASGKSTWALQQIAAFDAGQVVRVNRDLIREMLHDSRFAGDVTEDLVKEVRDLALTAAMRRRVPVVISDDTNLDDETYSHLVGLVADGYQVGIKDFRDVDWRLCRERNAQRALAGQRAVPEPVIEGMYREYIDVGVAAVPEQMDTP